jgi:hypothetical protein
MTHTATLLPICLRIEKVIASIDTIIIDRDPSLIKKKQLPEHSLQVLLRSKA